MKNTKSDSQIFENYADSFFANTTTIKCSEDFLGKNEENIIALLNKINIVFDEVSMPGFKRLGRRYLDLNFKYDEIINHNDVPNNGLSFKESITKSLEALEGCIRWHNPNALFNITHSPMLDTIALTLITKLYNPNSLWDITSGKYTLLEKRVVKILASLANWNTNNCGGISTFGGKATLMYAIKSGVNKADKSTIIEGINGNIVVLTSGAAHFSIESVCNYLGIGKKNCCRIPTGRNGTIDLKEFENMAREYLKLDKKIGCIILSGGGTVNLSIDPVFSVRRIINKLAIEYKLDYIPHIHFDTVISWVWLFFQFTLDFKFTYIKSKVIVNKILKAYKLIKQVKYADSFGVDFHKTGLCPYSSSFFVTKNYKDILNLNNELQNHISQDKYFGDVCNFDRTFENSRSCSGVITAYQVINRLGKQGFQSYLIYFLHVNELFKKIISQSYKDYFEVINKQSLGFEIVIKIHFLNTRISYKKMCQFTVNDQQEYRQLCNEFSEFINNHEFCEEGNTPFIGYITNYKFGNKNITIPAFLLYPVSMNLDEPQVKDIVNRLKLSVKKFNELKKSGKFISTKRWENAKEPPK